MSTSQSHPFVPPTESDSRSPCPALNALANHGYLPHDGKNMGLFQLVRGLQEGYNISLPLSVILSLGGVLVCGRWGKLSLADLSKHGRIEHDASLVHVDAAQGDASIPNEELLNELLADASDPAGLSLDDFARARVRRQAHLKAPLKEPWAEIARGESVMTCKMFAGPNGRVPKECIRQWYFEERLPDGWVRPAKTVGLSDVKGQSKELKAMVAQIETQQKGR